MILERGKWLLIAENSKISWSILLFRGEKELFELRLGKLGRYLDFTVLNRKLLGFKY
jgi:hypothetical protein